MLVVTPSFSKLAFENDSDNSDIVDVLGSNPVGEYALSRDTIGPSDPANPVLILGTRFFGPRDEKLECCDCSVLGPCWYVPASRGE